MVTEIHSFNYTSPFWMGALICRELMINRCYSSSALLLFYISRLVASIGMVDTCPKSRTRSDYLILAALSLLNNPRGSRCVSGVAEYFDLFLTYSNMGIDEVGILT